MSESIDCPACGAPIDSSLRFENQIECPYCGTQSYIGDSNKAISDDSPDDAHATLTQVYSRFELDQRGTINLNSSKMEYVISGRMQYEYEGGYWSEWYLEVGEKGYWLQEDEGVYILFMEVPSENMTSLLELYESYNESPEQFRAGRIMPAINNDNWHLMESGTAKMVAYEGILPYPPNEGKEITYFDGVGKGYRYSIEIEDNGKEWSVFMGTPLEYTDIEPETSSGEDYYGG